MAAKYETGAEKRLDETLIQTLTHPFKEIPVIDISAVDSPELSDRIALAKEIREECEMVGFSTFLITVFPFPALRAVRAWRPIFEVRQIDEQVSIKMLLPIYFRRQRSFLMNLLKRK